MKFIIHNKIGLEDSVVFALINVVINKGMISESRFGPQYSYVTTFNKADVLCFRRHDTFTFQVVKSSVSE